jgi:hypothetical protein
MNFPIDITTRNAAASSDAAAKSFFVSQINCFVAKLNLTNEWKYDKIYNK